VAMVQWYAHLSADHKRAALGRLISGRSDTTTDTGGDLAEVELMAGAAK
jgi:hypothetical protein